MLYQTTQSYTIHIQIWIFLMLYQTTHSYTIRIQIWIFGMLYQTTQSYTINIQIFQVSSVGFIKKPSSDPVAYRELSRKRFTFHVGLRYNSFIISIKINQYHYRPEVPRGFQEVKVPRFRDNGPEWW